MPVDGKEPAPALSSLQCSRKQKQSGKDSGLVTFPQGCVPGENPGLFWWPHLTLPWADGREEVLREREDTEIQVEINLEANLTQEYL